jgi:hypothetical protein
MLVERRAARWVLLRLSLSSLLLFWWQGRDHVRINAGHAMTTGPRKVQISCPTVRNTRQPMRHNSSGCNQIFSFLDHVTKTSPPSPTPKTQCRRRAFCEFLGPSGRASRPILARTLAGRGFSRQRREGWRQAPLISQLHLDATVERAATVGVVVGERFE